MRLLLLMFLLISVAGVQQPIYAQTPPHDQSATSLTPPAPSQEDRSPATQANSPKAEDVDLVERSQSSGTVSSNRKISSIWDENKILFTFVALSFGLVGFLLYFRDYFYQIIGSRRATAAPHENLSETSYEKLAKRDQLKTLVSQVEHLHGKVQGLEDDLQRLQASVQLKEQRVPPDVYPEKTNVAPVPPPYTEPKDPYIRPEIFYPTREVNVESLLADSSSWSSQLAVYHALVDNPVPEQRNDFVEAYAVKSTDFDLVSLDDSGALWWLPLPEITGYGLILPGHKLVRDWPKYRGQMGAAARAPLDKFYDQHEGSKLRIVQPAIGTMVDGLGIRLFTRGRLEGA